MRVDLDRPLTPDEALAYLRAHPTEYGIAQALRDPKGMSVVRTCQRCGQERHPYVAFKREGRFLETDVPLPPEDFVCTNCQINEARGLPVRTGA